MASVSSSAVTAFEDFRFGRADVSYLVFKLVGDGEIDVVKQGPAENTTWEDLCEFECVDKEPCWVTYHFNYETTDGGKRSKLILLKWVPDDCGIKQKMTYSMWSGLLKQTLNGIACTIQACSRSDLGYEEVLERAARFERDEIAR